MSIILKGTLSIDGDKDYDIRYVQARNNRTWFLYEQEMDTNTTDVSQYIVAVLKMTSAAQSFGYGKHYILTRLTDVINRLSYRVTKENAYDVGFMVKASYQSQDGEDFFSFKTFTAGGDFLELQLSSEGFHLDMVHVSNDKVPKFDGTKLVPILGERANAAVVSSLGFKTAAMLKRSMGDRLNFLERKKYTLIDSDEKFEQMFLQYLRDVQTAGQKGEAVLTGLDTETTGLHMVRLSPDNPARDHIVAIPFAWEDDISYLICMDMEYLDNVSESLVYDVFNKVFLRNEDFSYPDIELDFCGEHFKFNREAIDLAGFNAIFDTQAFMCHDVPLFFDDDANIIFYNLATDWVQGKNSLKDETRRLFNEETLELEELFGAKNKDKFRYLKDPELALIYGCADADYTRLVTKEARDMTDPALYKLYRKYDITLLHSLARAAYIGLPIDTQSVKELGDKVFQDIETLKEFIYRYAYAANKNNLEEYEDKLYSVLYRTYNSEEDRDAIFADGVLPQQRGLRGVKGVYDGETVEEARDMLEGIQHVEEEKAFRFKFTPANIKHLLFDILHYPVLMRGANGDPTFDKFVRKKLMEAELDTPSNILLESIPSASEPDTPLIDKDKFNRLKYPIAMVLEKYAVLNKEYTSYYKPIIDNDLEGHMFYSFSMSRAATRRILSPGQTMKGSLKGLVKAPPGKLFMCFDVSQMEYRLMASLAYIKMKQEAQEKYGDTWEEHVKDSSIYGIVKMMTNEEADYHIETAAFLTNTPQYRITHKVRKQFKCIGFGIPYGLSIPSLSNDLYGNKSAESIQKTTELYNQYCDKQKEIISLLEDTRDSAFKPCSIPQKMRDWMQLGTTNVGKVTNLAGFYRLFVLEKLTVGRTNRIRRQAGNCVIQGGAAELYRRMMYNFTYACAKAGLSNKIDLHMVVHDEGDYTCDADIDVLQVIALLYENCVLRYPDHIPYFIGIGFGSSWAEAKDDGAELPIRMVRLMVDAWHKGEFDLPRDGKQPSYLLALKRHYMCDRIEQELSTIIPGLKAGHQWTQEEADKVDVEFTNYIVRAYLEIFSKSKDLLSQLKDWQAAREKYGFGVDFLTERFGEQVVGFEGSKGRLSEMHLDGQPRQPGGDIDLGISSDDLFIELLENASEEDSRNEKEGNILTDGALFNSEELLGNIDDNAYSFYVQQDEEAPTVEYNSAATNAYDVFMPTKYTRTKVLKSSDSVYTVLLSGTKWDSRRDELVKEMRKHFVAGNAILVLIGSKITKIKGINPDEEGLDWLDKTICGKS